MTGKPETRKCQTCNEEAGDLVCGHCCGVAPQRTANGQLRVVKLVFTIYI